MSCDYLNLVCRKLVIPNQTSSSLSITAPVCPFEKGFILTDDDRCVCPTERSFYVDENGNCQRCLVELGFILTDDGRCICDPEKGYVLTAGGICDCPLPGVKNEDGKCVGEHHCQASLSYGSWKRVYDDKFESINFKYRKKNRSTNWPLVIIQKVIIMITGVFLPSVDYSFDFCISITNLK